MKLIMENWRRYQKREELLDDPVYITEVLGIKIPLNESYPYSLGLMEEVYKEQLLVESALQSALDYAKKKTAPARDIIMIMAKALKDRTGGWMNQFSQKLYQTIIQPLSLKLQQQLFKWKQRPIWDWIKTNVLDPSKKLSGFRKLINWAALAVFLRVAFDKLLLLSKMAEQGAGALKKPLDQWLTAWFGDPWIKIKDLAAKALEKTFDVRMWLKALGPVVGSLSVVTKALEPATKGFAGRETVDQEHIEGQEACQVKKLCSPTKPTQVGPKAGSRAGLISPEDCIKAGKDCQTHIKQSAIQFKENLKDESTI